MGVVSIMATILEDELREYGVLKLTKSTCETIVRSVIQRTAEVAADINDSQLVSHTNKQT